MRSGLPNGTFNLPPGCSLRDIDEAAGVGNDTPKCQVCGDDCDRVFGGYGYDTLCRDCFYDAQDAERKGVK